MEPKPSQWPVRDTNRKPTVRSGPGEVSANLVRTLWESMARPLLPEQEQQASDDQEQKGIDHPPIRIEKTPARLPLRPPCPVPRLLVSYERLVDLGVGILGIVVQRNVFVRHFIRIHRFLSPRPKKSLESKRKRLSVVYNSTEKKNRRNSTAVSVASGRIEGD